MENKVKNTKNTLDINNMLNKRILVIIAMVVLQLTTLSCKKKEVMTNEQKTKEYAQKLIEFKIEFPDTLYVNQSSDGVIRYKSVLDTIIKTFGDRKKNRYTRFILTTTNNPIYDYKHLKQTVKDTFGAKNNREIPLYDIKFSKVGTYYIDGIINDIVLLDLDKKDKEGDDLSRYIENEERVTHKVVVIENPNPPTKKSKQK